jgi:hypothetical protein
VQVVVSLALALTQRLVSRVELEPVPPERKPLARTQLEQQVLVLQEQKLNYQQLQSIQDARRLEQLYQQQHQ